MNHGKGKRKAGMHPPPKWGVVRDMLHMRIKDAAEELDVTVPYLRSLCHENGFPTWPGKRIRYMNSAGLMLPVGALEGSPLPGLAAGPYSQPAKIAETKKEEEEHRPKELVTLNLIDKVGSSSGSKHN